MQIQPANIKDSRKIKQLYLQTFDRSESELVSNIAVDLLQKNTDNIISLVAMDDDKIIGHIAFSPVFLNNSNECFGYILAPLAVIPNHQNNGIGSKLVKYGLDMISSLGIPIVFVYGDPQYYSRFDFGAELAQEFLPAHNLEYPTGWLAVRLDSSTLPGGGSITCVDSLDNPNLW